MNQSAGQSLYSMIEAASRLDIVDTVLPKYPGSADAGQTRLNCDDAQVGAIRGRNLSW